jgi:hypothetical protein
MPKTELRTLGYETAEILGMMYNYFRHIYTRLIEHSCDVYEINSRAHRVRVM